VAQTTRDSSQVDGRECKAEHVAGSRSAIGRHRRAKDIAAHGEHESVGSADGSETAVHRTAERTTYSAYESLVKEFPDRLIPAGCWMHTCRGFDEATATTSHPLAADSLARIQVLYDIDEQTKALSFDERRAVHERQSRPLIERLFASWEEALPTLRPSTKLAEAIGYVLNRRPELMRFTDDGRLQLDTGHLERSLRPVAVARKNYLLYGSLRGGQTAATLYSVVQSARLYHLATFQLELRRFIEDISRLDGSRNLEGYLAQAMINEMYGHNPGAM
jgi:hypothetical protein